MIALRKRIVCMDQANSQQFWQQGRILTNTIPQSYPILPFTPAYNIVDGRKRQSSM
jgi:hypothetical protein